MSFTPKIDSRPVVRGILTIAVVGLIGLVGQFVPKLTPIGATGEATRCRKSTGRATRRRWYTQWRRRRRGLQGTYYQPVSSWYKNKHWWKRNAPIVGGAGGGALIGGLAGGGKGALIGGAVGGGGGYAYKRLSHRNRYHRNYHKNYHK